MLGAALVLVVVTGLLLWLGVRLWRGSDRGAPERWLALTFGALAFGVLPRLASARLLSTYDEGALALALNAASHFAMEAAIIGLALFTWRVFRPNSGLARFFVAGVAAVSGLLTLWLVATADSEQEASALALAVNASRTVPILWAFAECTRYARLMRRRVSLALADPLVANRFLLWSVWTGALSFAGILLLAVRSRAFWLQLNGVDPRLAMPAAIPLTALVAGLAAVSAGVAVWLAFFPPASYRRWLRA